MLQNVRSVSLAKRSSKELERLYTSLTCAVGGQQPPSRGDENHYLTSMPGNRGVRSEICGK